MFVFRTKRTRACPLDVQGFQNIEGPFFKTTYNSLERALTCGVWPVLRRDTIIDVVFLCSLSNTWNSSTEDQPPTLNIFGKRWKTYTLSRTRCSNGLAHNRSNVSVTHSQIGFVNIIFLRSIFSSMPNTYGSG